MHISQNYISDVCAALFFDVVANVLHMFLAVGMQQLSQLVSASRICQNCVSVNQPWTIDGR